MSTIASTIRNHWQRTRDRVMPDVGHMPPSVREEFLDIWWTGMHERDERM